MHPAAPAHENVFGGESRHCSPTLACRVKLPQVFPAHPHGGQDRIPRYFSVITHPLWDWVFLSRVLYPCKVVKEIHRKTRKAKNEVLVLGQSIKQITSRV